LRYNLAWQVADYLAQVDAGMRAVYLYDPEYPCGNYDSLDEGPSPSSAINLIVWTRAQGSISQALVENLSAAFHAARAKILCPNVTGWCFALQVAFVDDVQVRQCEGYAMMINSPAVRPTQIWAKYSVR
jgi:hypothetical protein